MKYLLSIIVLLNSISSYADSFVKYGIGIGYSGKDSYAETKLLGLGYNSELLGDIKALSFIKYQQELGFWVDNKTNDKRKSSAYGNTSLGIDIKGGFLTASSFHGVGLVSNPDIYLGSYYQFFHDISGGLTDDKSKASITLTYKHISNAGLKQPNIGRDFLLFKLSIPW